MPERLTGEPSSRERRPAPIISVLIWPLLVWLALPAVASAQAAAGATAQSGARIWTIDASLATYAFPDEDTLLQPTVSGDRGALHLEARYNYEDIDSTSMFAGWNLALGSAVKLEFTPMVGFVVGRTDGGIVGVKADLSWRFLEAYTEGEYVVPGDGKDRFLYNWSEFSVWPTGWLRAGMVTQRTRTFNTFRAQRESERGFLVGLAGWALEGTFYFFNPGSDAKYFVAAFGVGF